MVFVYLHFRYDRVTHKNDIALVKLQRPVVYRDGLKPACLPKRFIGYPLNSLRTKPTIIGWGKTGNNHPVSPHLKQVSVPLVDTGTCNSKYKKVGDGVKIDNTQICAGDDSSDSCSGDSGGPLFLRENGRLVMCASAQRNIVFNQVIWGRGPPSSLIFPKNI